MKAQLDELSNEKVNFLHELPKLSDKCEDQQSTISELIKEKENLQYNLENIRSEKFLVDQIMSEMNLTVCCYRKNSVLEFANLFFFRMKS